MFRFVVLLTLGSANTLAQEKVNITPLITDRLGYSETPFLIGKGDLQLDSGFIYQFDSDTIFDNKSITYNF